MMVVVLEVEIIFWRSVILPVRNKDFWRVDEGLTPIVEIPDIVAEHLLLSVLALLTNDVLTSTHGDVESMGLSNGDGDDDDEDDSDDDNDNDDVEE